MRVTTKTGDKGMTSLNGGVRVEKDSLRIECNGLIDELDVRIGLLRMELAFDHEWQKKLARIQRDLMKMMSHIATVDPEKYKNPVEHAEEGLTECERWCDELLKGLENEKLGFFLPGGTRFAALAHSCRTGARTAERCLVTLMRQENLPSYIVKYINRSSDLFYLLATTSVKDANLDHELFMLFPSEK